MQLKSILSLVDSEIPIQNKEYKDVSYFTEKSVHFDHKKARIFKGFLFSGRIFTSYNMDANFKVKQLKFPSVMNF